MTHAGVFLHGRYRTDLGGALLSYSHVELAGGSDSGRVIDDNPSLHFDVDVQGVLFAPQVGQHLVGVVNKVRGPRGPKIMSS